MRFTQVRRTLAIFALAAALLLPGSALAADITSSTSEGGIVVPATIAMTVPATATFTKPGVRWTYTQSVTAISTNNPSGLTITQKVTALVNGATVVPTTARETSYGGAIVGLVKGTNPNKGTWLDSTTVMIAATAAGVVTDGSFTHAEYIDAVDVPNIPGTYASSTSFTATTNP